VRKNSFCRIFGVLFGSSGEVSKADASKCQRCAMQNQSYVKMPADSTTGPDGDNGEFAEPDGDNGVLVGPDNDNGALTARSVCWVDVKRF